MTIHLGYVDASSTLYIPFASYDSSGASVTLTGLAVTDIEIYKNGSVTQRASDNGYTLLDTDGIDFDSVTGIHGFSIDLSDDSDSGFYSEGAFYWVVVSSVTIDSQTVNFIAATFFIGPQNTNTSRISGDSTAADNAEAFFDGTGYAGTNNVIPSVTTVTGNVNGSVASVTGAINTAAGTITTLDGLDTAQDLRHDDTQTDIAALNNLSAAQVNAQVVDALATDTYAEPGQGAPAATTTLAAKLNYLYKWSRNKKDNDGSTTQFYADDGSTVDQKQTTSESGGTVTKGEIVSGP